MATFGTFPGVQVTTTGGSVTGVAIGREQKAIFIGNGDSSSGSASVNEATQIDSPSDATDKFGSGTELADALQHALDNGANIDFLYGIMLDEIDVTSETVAQSDTLANAPIVEDSSLITINDTGSGDDPSFEFRYDSPPATPGSGDTAFLNPTSGEIEFDAASSSDYEINYTHPDWSSALTEAESVIDVEETGVITALSEAESVASDLVSSIGTLRSDYKMAIGHSGAEHNSNTSDNDAQLDTTTYTDSVDDDAYFLAGPVRLVDSSTTVLGASGGQMAGASLSESVYDTVLQNLGDDLEQNLSKSDADDLRSEDVIPIRQTQAGSPIKMEDNRSTSTSSDWTRDLFTRRIVDQVVLIAKEIGDTIVGRINNEENRRATEDAIEAEIRDLVRRGLLTENPTDGSAWRVDVYDTDTANEVGIDISVTPHGVTKQVNATVTINTD